MTLSTTPLDGLAGMHLDALIGVAEGDSLDFKQELAGRSDKDKLEFVADVAAMSNGAGGAW